MRVLTPMARNIYQQTTTTCILNKRNLDCVAYNQISFIMKMSTPISSIALLLLVQENNYPKGTRLSI